MLLKPMLAVIIKQECWLSVKKTALYFFFHLDKSVFQPKRALTFVGFAINSIDMTVQLTLRPTTYGRHATTILNTPPSEVLHRFLVSWLQMPL